MTSSDPLAVLRADITLLPIRLDALWGDSIRRTEVLKLLDKAEKSQKAELSQLYSDFIQKELDTQVDSFGEPIAVYILSEWNELVNRLAILSGRKDLMFAPEEPTTK